MQSIFSDVASGALEGIQYLYFRNKETSKKLKDKQTAKDVCSNNDSPEQTFFIIKRKKKTLYVGKGLFIKLYRIKFCKYWIKFYISYTFTLSH